MLPTEAAHGTHDILYRNSDGEYDSLAVDNLPNLDAIQQNRCDDACLSLQKRWFLLGE